MNNNASPERPLCGTNEAVPNAFVPKRSGGVVNRSSVSSYLLQTKSCKNIYIYLVIVKREVFFCTEGQFMFGNIRDIRNWEYSYRQVLKLI